MTLLNQEMTENATHLFIHHYVEYASSLHFGMTCCTVLTAVIIIILLILLGIVIYVVVSSKKCGKQSKKTENSRSRRNRSIKNLIDDASSCNVANNSPRTSTVRNFEEEVNPQGIPLTTFCKRSKVNDRTGDSSESSAGLYDILFPDQQQGGEIIREPPSTLVLDKFTTGQVLSVESSINGSDQAGPSASGLKSDGASESLDWDYFQQNPSEDGPETPKFKSTLLVIDSDRIHNVCWV